MLFGMDIGGTLAKIVFREPEHIASVRARLGTTAHTCLNTPCLPPASRAAVAVGSE